MPYAACKNICLLEMILYNVFLLFQTWRKWCEPISSPDFFFFILAGKPKNFPVIGTFYFLFRLR